MIWRPGLRASIALTVSAVTITATVTMALVSYQMQAGATRDRFIASAKADFGSDAQQAHQFLVRATPRAATKVDEVAEYLTGRLALTWALVNLKDSSGPLSHQQDGTYTAVMASPGLEGARFTASQVDQARQRLQPVTYTDYVGGSLQLIIIGQAEPDLLLVEIYSTKRMDAELLVLRIELAGVAAVVAVLGIVLGILAARRIQRRVSTAAAAARTFGEGALDVRLPVVGRDELADLAGSFNAMAERLGESIEQLHAKDRQQRRFVADVAHDLRTPLAAMIAASDSLHSPDPEDRDRSAELLGTQVRRLSALVEDLLEMSRFDAGAADFRPETVDVDALAADAVELAAPDAGITVRVVGNPVVQGDPRRLHTIVRNLVSNAIHHGGQPITVTVDGSSADEVRVVVADSGPGLPAELAPFVFDRFVRGDHARRQSEGSGLGLAIAHENAVLHGGRIEVTDSGGAVFTLIVPRGEPHDLP